MPQTIKLKRSAIAGQVPTITQLELGEIAINTTDGKIFLKKKDALNVESIIEVQANAVGTAPSFGSSTTAPTSAVEGDFWYNTSDNTLYIYNGSDWAAIGGDGAQSFVTTNTVDPTTRTDGTALQSGDTYWNTNDSDLYLYNGSDWVTVAPAAPAVSIPHLGHDTSNPTTRPSGDALNIGDVYWNTADSEMRVYTGTAGNLWTPLGIGAGGGAFGGQPVLSANTSFGLTSTSGTGTSGSPFVFPVTNVIPGDSVVIDTVTVTGLDAHQNVLILDQNNSSNGNKFKFNSTIANASGTLVFNIVFDDLPASSAGTSYTLTLQIGTATVYCSYPVSIVALLAVSPTIDMSNVGATTSFTTSWTGATETLSTTGDLEISGDNATWVTSGLVMNNGDSLYVRWAGAAGSGTGIDGADGSTITGSIVSSGGSTHSDSLVVDKTPDSVTLGTDSNVVLSGVSNSNTVTISGANSWIYITGTGTDLEYEKNSDGTWTSVPASGTSTDYVINGGTIEFRHTNDLRYSTQTISNINLGDLTGLVYSSTTASAAPGSLAGEQAILTPSSGGSGGLSVSIDADGNTAILGKDPSAFVFTRSGTTWTQQQILVSSDYSSGDFYGTSVAISADGNTAIVGAHRDDSVAPDYDAGAAYIFTRSGSTWTQQQKIVAPTRQFNDNFGWDVSISGDGNTVCVGAIEQWGGYSFSDIGGPGSAYVFTRSGGVWTLEQKLTASNATNDHEFGYSTSLSSDGNIAVIGAMGENTVGTYAGAAYVFTRSGGVWTEEQKIVPDDIQSNDYFGQEVAISSDGSTITSGSAGESTTASGAGSVYVFTKSGGIWTQQQKMQALDAASSDFLGQSVTISGNGDTIVVGSTGSDDIGSNAGAAYIFTRSAGVWTQQQKTVVSNAAASKFFPSGIAISSNGSYWIGASGNGTAYIFV